MSTTTGNVKAEETLDTLARWVRDMMRRAGITNYVSHSRRPAASSTLAKRIPMKKHYRKEVVDDKTVGESLLR